MNVIETQPRQHSFRLYPYFKRLMDIFVSSTIILMISPILILVAVAIKLESKGPVFYISKRVGRNFEVFDFYKFRSMRVNADKELDNMKHLNQYNKEEHLVASQQPSQNQNLHDQGEMDFLIADDGFWEEDQIIEKEQNEEKNSFNKIQNDPRITKVGRFIRNTSIDELPQLLNILKGDMSLVGNRPLPLYEAEKLTSDDWIERFDAPAGLTGLWQVTDRGKKDVSIDSRKRLDVKYARNYSFVMDMMILIKTLPAALQSENV